MLKKIDLDKIIKEITDPFLDEIKITPNIPQITVYGLPRQGWDEIYVWAENPEFNSTKPISVIFAKKGDFYFSKFNNSYYQQKLEDEIIKYLKKNHIPYEIKSNGDLYIHKNNVNQKIKIDEIKITPNIPLLRLNRYLETIDIVGNDHGYFFNDIGLGFYIIKTLPYYQYTLDNLINYLNKNGIKYSTEQNINNFLLKIPKESIRIIDNLPEIKITPNTPRLKIRKIGFNNYTYKFNNILIYLSQDHTQDDYYWMNFAKYLTNSTYNTFMPYLDKLGIKNKKYFHQGDVSVKIDPKDIEIVDKLDESKNSSIGLFPGKFKLPHKGHFDVAKKLAEQCSKVIILISPKPHGGFTSSQSLAIWELYKSELPDNIEIKISTESPMKETYDFIAKNPNTNILAAFGKNEGDRFKSILSKDKYKHAKIFDGGNFENIHATDLRRAIENKDVKNLKTFLPDNINYVDFLNTIKTRVNEIKITPNTGKIDLEQDSDFKDYFSLDFPDGHFASFTYEKNVYFSRYILPSERLEFEKLQNYLDQNRIKYSINYEENGDLALLYISKQYINIVPSKNIDEEKISEKQLFQNFLNEVFVPNRQVGDYHYNGLNQEEINRIATRIGHMLEFDENPFGEDYQEFINKEYNKLVSNNPELKQIPTNIDNYREKFPPKHDIVFGAISGIPPEDINLYVADTKGYGNTKLPAGLKPSHKKEYVTRDIDEIKITPNVPQITILHLAGDSYLWRDETKYEETYCGKSENEFIFDFLTGFEYGLNQLTNYLDKKGIKYITKKTNYSNRLNKISIIVSEKYVKVEKYKDDLNESHNPKERSKDLMKTLKIFIKFTVDKLELKSGKLPKLTLSYDTLGAKQKSTFGQFDPSENRIWLYVKNRNKADILRTLAHELVHRKQEQDGKLNLNSGDTGSEIENEANAQAGVLLRDFGQIDKSIYEGLQKEIKIIPNIPYIELKKSGLSFSRSILSGPNGFLVIFDKDKKTGDFHTLYISDREKFIEILKDKGISFKTKNNHETFIINKNNVKVNIYSDETNEIDEIKIQPNISLRNKIKQFKVGDEIKYIRYYAFANYDNDKGYPTQGQITSINYYIEDMNKLFKTNNIEIATRFEIEINGPMNNLNYDLLNMYLSDPEYSDNKTFLTFKKITNESLFTKEWWDKNLELDEIKITPNTGDFRKKVANLKVGNKISYFNEINHIDIITAIEYYKEEEGDWNVCNFNKADVAVINSIGPGNYTNYLYVYFNNLLDNTGDNKIANSIKRI